jgi:hypothetical protein
MAPATIEATLALSMPNEAPAPETLANVRVSAVSAVLSVTPIRTLRGSLVQLSCDLPMRGSPQRAVLRVLDESGTLLRVVADETVTGATFLAWWDCTDSGRRLLAGGTYVVELVVGDTHATSQIVLAGVGSREFRTAITATTRLRLTD